MTTPADIKTLNPATPQAPPRASLRHPLTLVFLGLTFVTGLIDAASYLGLGHVFSANMTGNIVLLGFGIAKAGDLPLIAPLVSLFAFLAGAAAGGALATRAGHRQKAHLHFALGLEFGCVAGAAIVSALAHPHPATIAAGVVIALLALGMGIRNATVRRISVPDLTTTVLTMTLTGLAADSPLGGGSGAGTVRRSSAVISLLAGALVGALLLKVGLTVVLACGAACVLVTAVTYAGATLPDQTAGEAEKQGG
ncbi:MAG TPA: YoaK family protein [Solirubrobacteraceae bacterium]|nr:YoaK family protein [Solirubrobacteraceae bacterium]